ncbi:MAG: 4-(cytidine 5'-diphospho)-2-C-methyl-D-erythritol kinase [Candidatus Sumerlaeia bacterium]|nr:4-(cytidine 5'-diphospho)-2-C-methyl-D-erythritol kinase [Candidatus Sumerlaeia bacterium]
MKGSSFSDSVVKTIEVTAYAKINLYLRVLSRRSDGYHNIETIYQSIDLADLLEFGLEEGEPTVNLTIEPHSIFKVPVDNSNLVFKALNLLKERTGEEFHKLRITLNKNIPVGAGLGGGSADAAATLIAINRLFSLGLDIEQLRELAGKIGADVPFFLQGGTALGTGRGDVIIPLQNNLLYYVVVVFPGFSIATAEAYKKYDLESAQKETDTIRRHISPAVSSMMEVLRQGSLKEFCSLMANDFTEVIEKLYPEIAIVRKELIDAGCCVAQLSGSGSAVFGICETQTQALQVLERVREKYKFTYLCKPTTKGVAINLKE